VGPIWVLRDEPPRKRGRKTEIFACGTDPRSTVEAAERARIGWHFLCDVVGPDEDLKARRAAFKALGYRAIATEWAYAHDSREIPVFDSDPPVRIVTSAGEFATIPVGAWRPRRWNPSVTQFAIWTEQDAYGWVHSQLVGDDAWVGDLYVPEEHRRHGYGRALMSALLRHDRDRGVRSSVLLASSAGSHLYPQLGYQLVGVLQMFCPRDREPSS